MNISEASLEHASKRFAAWTREDWDCRDRYTRLAIERKAARVAAKTGDDNVDECLARKRAQELDDFVKSVGDEDRAAMANQTYLVLEQAIMDLNTAREHFRQEVREHNKRLIKAKHNLITMIEHNRASGVYQQWKKELAIIEDLYKLAYNEFRDATKTIGNHYG